jgi:hypothetical protein
MFQDTDFTTVVSYLIGIWVIIIIVEWLISKNKPPLKKALNSFTASLIMMGILVFVMYVSLPSTFGLESYSYPKEFKSLEEVHEYLKEHNRILVRLRDVVYWFLFFFFISFLPALHGFAKAMVNVNGSNHHNDK